MPATRLIMGILNITPDSFSDGGLYTTTETALRHAEQLEIEGADIIDVGGESSRPGSQMVSVDEEIRRVIPVIKELKKRSSLRISVDTTKSEVAQAAVENGATLINDISGGSDIGMAELVKQPGVEIVLMHMRGTPVTMQIQPLYPRGVMEEVKKYLETRMKAFEEAGVERSKIWLDPGIGFGKTVAHNLEILKRLSELTAMSPRVVVGTSRKSFLANLLGQPSLPFEEREAGTLASSLYAFEQGASVFRVHNVVELRKALITWEAIRNGR